MSRREKYLNYIPVGAGAFKNVFLRKEGYQPRNPHMSSYRQKNRYVSSFLVSMDEALDELKQSKIVHKLDPFEVFTVQPQHYLVYQNPTPKKKEFFKDLRHRMTKLDGRPRESDYLYEIIYPYAGVEFTKVLEQKSRQGKRMSLKEFIYPILFLIYWVGYMNKARYTHKDIKDNNIMFKDGRLYLIDFGYLSETFADIYGIEREHPNNPPELEFLLRLRDSGTENYDSLVYTRQEYMDILEEKSKYMFHILDLYHQFYSVPISFDILNESYVQQVKKDNLDAAESLYSCLEASKSMPSSNKEIEQRKFRECLESTLPKRLETFQLYGQKFDAYQLGCTILTWCDSYAKFYANNLSQADQSKFSKFGKWVTWYLTTFDVTRRLSLSDFHKTIIQKPYAKYLFEDVGFLKDYRAFCQKIYKPLKNIRTEDAKESKYIEREKKVFKKLLSKIKTGMEEF